jgi:hypothetical protein
MGGVGVSISFSNPSYIDNPGPGLGYIRPASRNEKQWQILGGKKYWILNDILTFRKYLNVYRGDVVIIKVYVKHLPTHLEIQRLKLKLTFNSYI